MKKSRKFVVKFEKNPFDKSFDTIHPILYENDKPFGVVDESVTWLKDGDIVDAIDLKCEFTSKKTKHAVPGDIMTWNSGPVTFEGTVDEIIENDKEYFDDQFKLINVTSMTPLQAFNDEFVKEPNVVKLRRDIKVKSWIIATMKCKCCDRWL